MVVMIMRVLVASRVILMVMGGLKISMVMEPSPVVISRSCLRDGVTVSDSV